ncbi:MAG: prepilin-type N-terminal cleavage/methylation domain-containing protein [candidate division Zixibacteria bacterium]
MPVEKRLNSSGFTLIELIIVIIVLGIVAAVAIPKMGDVSQNSKTNATRTEMLTLKRAIIGNPQVIAGNRHANPGFEGDVGHPPITLSELAIKPDSIATYDRFLHRGWNGPYVDSAGNDYLKDAWDVAYIYDGINRKITSAGGPDSIVVSF